MASAAPRCRSTAWASRTATATAATRSTRRRSSEMVAQTSGISAEVNADGPVMNIIPQGGRQQVQRHRQLRSSPTTELESSNLNDELRARGFTEREQDLSDVRRGVERSGGPIMQDKLWFLGALRTWGFSRQIAGAYWNKTQNVVPDARPARSARSCSGRRGSIVRWSEDSGRLRVVHTRASAASPGRRRSATSSTSVRLPARVQLLRRDAGERAGSDQRLQVPAEPAHAGDLELAADQPVCCSKPGSAFSISQWNAYWQPACTPDIIRVTRPDARRQLRGADHLPRLAELHRPLHAAVLGDLRHRHALVQDRRADRACWSPTPSTSPTAT